nr:hypothetical protein [Candidatus Sigynarchaeota archaeon]
MTPATSLQKSLLSSRPAAAAARASRNQDNMASAFPCPNSDDIIGDSFPGLFAVLPFRNGPGYRHADIAARVASMNGITVN